MEALHVRLVLFVAPLLQAAPVPTEPSPQASEALVPTRRGRTAVVDLPALRVRLWLGEPGRCKRVTRSRDGAWIARLLGDDEVVLHDARDGSVRTRLASLPWVAPPPLDFDAPDWDATWREDRELRFAGEDDRVVLARGQRATELWALEPAARLALLEVPGDVPVCALDVSPDGALVATADGSGLLAVWRARDGGPAREPIWLADGIGVVRFDANGERLVVGTASGRLWVVDLDDGSRRELELAPEETHLAAGATGLALDPAGTTLLAWTRMGCPRSLGAWDLGTGRRLWREVDHRLSVGHARFDRAGEHVLLAGGLTRLDARTGARLSRAFPKGTSERLELTGEAAWSVSGDRLRVYDFAGGLRVRDLDIGHPDDG